MKGLRGTTVIGNTLRSIGASATAVMREPRSRPEGGPRPGERRTNPITDVATVPNAVPDAPATCAEADDATAPEKGERS